MHMRCKRECSLRLLKPQKATQVCRPRAPQKHSSWCSFSKHEEHLLPLATIATPNLMEAQLLLGGDLQNSDVQRTSGNAEPRAQMCALSK
eukprot:2526006-Amphidinium_carterae.1